MSDFDVALADRFWPLAALTIGVHAFLMAWAIPQWAHRKGGDHE